MHALSPADERTTEDGAACFDRWREDERETCSTAGLGRSCTHINRLYRPPIILFVNVLV
jgi:hypothetical protein